MKKIAVFLLGFNLVLLSSCVPQNSELLAQYENLEKSDGLFVVDCLLPGQIRKLGQLATYLTARRPIKTTAAECEIRGGEYVAYDRASYSTALKVWLSKAKGGDAEAQAYVGEIYEKGMGLIPDYQLARKWYLKSAAQGNARAQISLGYLYEKGFGVQKDLAIAFEWYKKSSGLDKTDIPYAATIESSSNNQLRNEITFLKTELKNSRNETKNLQNQLNETQLSIQQNQQKLIAKQTEFENSKKLLTDARKNSDNDEVFRLQSVISAQEREINAQSQNIAALEKQYQKKVLGLNIQLDETQKRATQIAEDLKQRQSAENQSAVKLLEAQAELAATEKRLFKLKQESLNAIDKITSEQLTQEQKTSLSLNLKQQEMQSIQQQLNIYEQEKTQQQSIINSLEKQSRSYQENIARLNKKLQSEAVPKAEVAQLKDQLQQQKLAAKDAKYKFIDTQKQLTKTEQQLAELQQNSRKERLKLKELEQLSLASSLKTMEVNKRLQKSEEKWLKQQTLISQLESEKKTFETTIINLQSMVKTQNSSEKPEIEIIDPPFVVVRGMPTVTLRSVVKQRDIIGRVSSSSGLLSLLVNDDKNSTDEQGIFTSSINLIDTETSVNIVAVDKKGKRASLDFILSLGKAIKTSQRNPVLQTVDQPLDQPWKKLDFGNYYGLIIGNSKYQKVPSLDTPGNDATEIAKVLKSQYGFNTTLLLNGTRYQILSALNKLRSQLSEKDNLLIYYAGHGELDKVNMRGHWLPVDADADNTANWISTVAITDILNMMTVKHIIVISDSCYSGAMTRSSLARLEAGSSGGKKSEWLKAMLKARSRTVLTSGGLKPVMDGGGGQHSVFANAFIKALKNNKSLLEGQTLYRKVSAGIVAIAAGYGIEQVPEYAPIRHAGHESGEFFFKPLI